MFSCFREFVKLSTLDKIFRRWHIEYFSDFSQKTGFWENLHEMSNPVFWEKQIKKISSNCCPERGKDQVVWILNVHGGLLGQWSITIWLNYQSPSTAGPHEIWCKLAKWFQKRCHLILKAPRKTASENVVCLCRLLNILADFSNLFLHTGK